MENSNLYAYILKATQLTASKWRLMLFSQDQGRMTVWFRPSKQTGRLDPFIPVWLTIKHRPSGQAVEKIESLTPTDPLTGEGLFAGWYLNELLTRLMPEQEPAHHVFLHYHAALTALKACSERNQLEIILRQFEWNLIVALGLGISLTHEAKTGQPICSEQRYQCVPELGLIKAHQGYPGQIYLNLAQANYASKETLQAAKTMMRLLLNHALGGYELKTRSLFRSMNVK